MMGLFDRFLNFIDSPVGNALTNLPEDVRRMKRSFKAIGLFNDDTENGYMTRELDGAIKVFQRNNALKIDGRINPRGETENRIWEVLSGDTNSKIERAIPETDTTPPVPDRKPVIPEKIALAFDVTNAPVFNNGELRKEILLHNTPAKFEIKENPSLKNRSLEEKVKQSFIKNEEFGN